MSYSYFNLTTYSYDTVKFADQFVPLTNGEASISLATAGWPEEFLDVAANATIGTKTVFDSDYLSLNTFDVYAQPDQYRYVLPNTSVNLTITTTPMQVGAAYNISITNSSFVEVWRFGAANGTNILDAQGKASKIITTAGWLPDTYDVTVTVNNTQFVETDSTSFSLYTRIFNIYISVTGGFFPSFSNYAMPMLNVTTSPGQTNANLTITLNYPTYYMFEKTSFDSSFYQYFIPFTEMNNESFGVLEVTVTSSIGENSTSDYNSYTHNRDIDGDGLPDSEEVSIGTSSTNQDTDGDGFFDGMEVFHGSDPLDQTILVSEPFVLQVLMITCLSIPLFLVLKRRQKFTNPRPAPQATNV